MTGIKGKALVSIQPLVVVAFCLLSTGLAFGQAITPKFGGLYADLWARQSGGFLAEQVAAAE